MIRHLIFDIGNVLVTFQPKQYFLPYFSSEEETGILCDMIFKHSLWNLYDQGLYTIQELQNEYCRLYPDKEGEVKMILHNWLQILQPIEESISFLKQMKERGYSIYLLSNISEDAVTYLNKTQSFMQLIDGGVYSYKEKINKPDVAIYERLLNRYHLNPGEVLYFDDLSANIEQARKIGMQGIVFTGIESIETAKIILKKEKYVKE